MKQTRMEQPASNRYGMNVIDEPQSDLSLDKHSDFEADDRLTWEELSVDEFGDDALEAPAKEDTETEGLNPNRPHQALEYAPLYFFLKATGLREAIKPLYVSRWRASYPLQKNVPHSQLLRKLKIHLTWGEALILVPFWVAMVSAILYTFVYPSVTVTGHVARTALIGCFAFAQRNSIITLLLGMPVDRALFYHKLSGRIAFFGTLGHAYAFYIDPRFQRGNVTVTDKLASSFDTTINTAGTFMSLMILGIILTSLPSVRRRLFELFYYVHILCIVGLVVGAFYHTGKLIPLLVACTWGVDLFFRSIVMARHRYPRKAKIRVMSKTVVELSFPKTQGFDYNAGQYIYISIPEISWLEWHPFSLSSSPKMKNVTLHIRNAGNWTNALYELAKKKGEVSISLEGPYGSLGVDLLGDHYKMVMLVSGGIGITPMQSICDQLLFEQAKQRRNLKRVTFIWTDRDPVMMQEAPVVVRANQPIDDKEPAEAEFDFQSPVIDLEANGAEEQYASVDERNSALIFSQLLSLLPPGMATDQQLEEIYESLDAVMDLDAAGLINSGDAPSDQHHGAGTSAGSMHQDHKSKGAETSVVDNHGRWHTDTKVEQDLGKILDMQLYMTGKDNEFNMPNARMGRPDLKQIFLDLKEEARAKGENRIAVCVCAPPRLSNICRKACVVYSDNEVRFDFHTESMEG